MCRTMPTLLLLAIWIAPAVGQTEEPAVVATPGHANACGCKQGNLSTNTYCSPAANPTAFGCSTGTPSQLAAYFNSAPYHPALWESYAGQRAAILDHRFAHFNGCNCLDPKRNLYANPSVICDQSRACESKMHKTKVVNRYKPRMDDRVVTVNPEPAPVVDDAPSLPGSPIAEPPQVPATEVSTVQTLKVDAYKQPFEQGSVIPIP